MRRGLLLEKRPVGCGAQEGLHSCGPLIFCCSDRVPAMADPAFLDPLKQWLHDLNNRVAVILNSAELLQKVQLSPQAAGRRQSIEDKALEVREILRAISEHYL